MRSLVEVIERNNLEARCADHPADGRTVSWGLGGYKWTVYLLLRLGLLGALQPDDEGDSEGKLLRSIDDTLSDVIATHDTTEDVDEDTLDLGVRDKNLERLLNRVGGGTSVAKS